MSSSTAPYPGTAGRTGSTPASWTTLIRFPAARCATSWADHLCAFHRFIFGDIYDWAGHLRRVDITKFDTFCRWIHLDAYSSEVFGKLARARWLRDRERVDFVAALAETYADINALHPFREGNGRAQRAFLQQLAHDAGHPLTWANLNATENERASIAGFRGDLEPLIAMLGELVEHEE